MISRPYPNELLSSWLIRHSIAHGTDPMGWIYGIWGEWRAWTRDIDRTLPQEQMIELVRFSRLSVEEMSSMTLASTLEKFSEKGFEQKASWNWIIPTGRRNRMIVSGLQFCPLCLNEKKIYFPKHWRLSWHTQCEIHHIALHSKCPECGQSFSPHLIDYQNPIISHCTRCGYDLKSTLTTPSPHELLQLQSSIDSICNDSTKCSLLYSLWGFEDNTSFFLFLRDILALPRMIAKHQKKYELWQEYLFGELRYAPLSTKFGFTFDMLTRTERETLLLIAYSILQNDRNNLLKSFRYADITRSQLTDRHFPSSPLLQEIITQLQPPPSIARNRAKRARSREPYSADVVEREMNEIRRYL